MKTILSMLEDHLYVLNTKYVRKRTNLKNKDFNKEYSNFQKRKNEIFISR